MFLSLISTPTSDLNMSFSRYLFKRHLTFVLVSALLLLSLSTLLSDAFWPVLPHAGSDFRESLGYTADAGRTAAANTPYKRSESSKLKALSLSLSLCIYIYTHIHICRERERCVYIYIYIYTHLYIHTHTHIHRHLCMYMCVYLSNYINMYVYICRTHDNTRQNN